MNKKFVLESFEAFIEFSGNSINEAQGGSEITPESVVGLVEKMLQKQKEMAKSHLRFKKFASSKDPYGDWKNSGGFEGLEGNPLNLAGAFAAPYLFDKLTDEQKKNLYIEVSKNLNNRGFNKIKEVEEKINKKESLGRSPVIYVFSSDVEIRNEDGEKENVEYSFIEKADENGIFKDNEWELKDSSFNSPEMKAKLVDPIKQFVSDFASGEITDIEYINIQSSANRYRNTGAAEGISWGELSYNRGVTIAKIFKTYSEEYGLSDKQWESLKNKIEINFGGANGDGTSGPNPIDPIAFGYYDKNSKFIRENGSYDKKRSTLVIDKLDEIGKPTGEIITNTIEPDSNKSDYNKYKYVNVTIKATILTSNSVTPLERVKDVKNEYDPGFKMPKKDPEKKPKLIPPIDGPGRSKGSGKPGRGQGRAKCPEL
jgi:hypothetical protein